MRLLYLTDRLSDRGGADHHLHQITGASIDAGHHVTVGFGRDEGGWMLPEGVESLRFRGLSDKVDSAARLKGFHHAVASADLVHIQNVMNPAALAMAVDAGCTVVTIQDHRVFCPGLGKTLPDGSGCAAPMEDAVCRQCLPDDRYRRSTLDLTRKRLATLDGAGVVVLSRYMACELADEGVTGVNVVPPWVEVGEEKRHPGTHFLVGGRLVAHKGVLDGWRAWRDAGRPLDLAVAGAGPLEDEFEGAKLMGWLGPVELRQALRGARALIFPARWQEPFGILGIEALAQGTPVVVADSGGTSEWSNTGCIVVPPGDVDAMAAAIKRLANDPAEALELGRAGQQMVSEVFSRGRIEPRIFEIYDRFRG